jgi:hypothetical protein
MRVVSGIGVFVVVLSLNMQARAPQSGPAAPRGTSDAGKAVWALGNT